MRNALLAAAAFAVSLILLEGGLRLFIPVPPTWRSPQTRHLESPLLGWVLPPGSRSFTIDAPVQVNSYGLRDDEIAVPKPLGELRILCLGDSFTFALGVRFEDLYVQQLEALLNARPGASRVQVINAGVAGYNTRQEQIFLLARGLALEPDLVSIAFYWNDLIGNDAPLPDLDTPWLPSDDPRLYERGERRRRHALPGWLREPLRKSVLIYTFATRIDRLRSMASPPDDETARVQRALLAGDDAFLEPYWRATEKRLLEIAETLEARAIPVVLIAFPMENQIRHDYPELALAERLREIWRPTGMPMIDLEPALRAALEAGENPFLPYDLHPNAAGMRIAARLLHETIRTHELIPSLRAGAP